MKMGDTITVYSQNVSCDVHSQKLMDIPEMGIDFKFDNRITALINALPVEKDVLDVVAFNEIRYAENVENTVAQLEKKGYNARAFANNTDVMSFNNILAIHKSSQWALERWEHLWVAKDNLKDTHCLIEGDPHGRCAAVAYLIHRKSGRQVCVLNSHVFPFGDLKTYQQNALFTINERNSKMNPPVPTIIVGDLNRFDDEEKKFQAQLENYNLVESHPTELVISSPKSTAIIKDKRDIGSFTPWPTDKVYEEKRRLPLSRSRLDVQLHSQKRIKNIRMTARAALLFEPNSRDKPEDVDPVRHQLDRTMTSDHIALFGTYKVN